MRQPACGRCRPAIQNMNFSASWPTRAVRAEVTFPKFALVTLPLGATELGVVENVEKLETELHDLRFRDAHVLQQRHVEVVRARAVKHARAASPHLPDDLPAEDGRVKVVQPRARIIGRQLQNAVQRTVGPVDGRTRTGAARAQQRTIPRIRQRNGSAVGEARDARQDPSAREPVSPEQMREW